MGQTTRTTRKHRAAAMWPHAASIPVFFLLTAQPQRVNYHTISPQITAELFPPNPRAAGRPLKRSASKLRPPGPVRVDAMEACRPRSLIHKTLKQTKQDPEGQQWAAVSRSRAFTDQCAWQDSDMMGNSPVSCRDKNQPTMEVFSHPRLQIKSLFLSLWASGRSQE